MSASVVDGARVWTYGRQRLGRAAPDAATALRDVIGVYSAHPSAPLSLWARSARFDAGAFRSLDALRLPAMRGSIHLLPDDVAHLPFRALQEGSTNHNYRLKRFGLTPERYSQLSRRVLKESQEPRTMRELGAALDVGEELKGVVGSMTRRGDLVRVAADGLRSNTLRYVAARVPEADVDEALAWLAGEYLRAFGPARARDFEWWSGVQVKRARAALDAVDTEDLEDGYLLLRGDRKGFEASKPLRGTVDLLPKWDPYTMGYPREGRGRLGDAATMERCYDFRGDGMPIVLVEGTAAGTWAFAGSGKRAQFAVEWFDKPAAKLRRAVDARSEELAAFLGP